jgi:hypothetical protein
MISEETVLHMVQRHGIKIDAFGSPVVDKFSMLVEFGRAVEKLTEDRFKGAPENQVAPLKRGRGRPKKVVAA